MIFSDKVDTMYPVTDNKDNQGGTRLVPASLISKDSKVGSSCRFCGSYGGQAG